jgi:hypothetical protein
VIRQEQAGMALANNGDNQLQHMDRSDGRLDYGTDGVKGIRTRIMRRRRDIGEGRDRRGGKWGFRMFGDISK